MMRRILSVHIAYTVEVDDYFRKAIRQFYGKDGLATRQEVADWFRAYGESMNDDLYANEETEGT